MDNPLAILGLNTGATLAEAQSRFRILAKIFHPDKGAQESSRFREIREALDTLENDPTLLQRENGLPARTTGKDLWVSATFTVEDLLFRENVSVVVHPKGRCPKCSGTGSTELKLHTCAICSGKGRVPGEYMRMATGSNECPGCDGTGMHIPHESRCPLCKGTSVVPAARIVKIEPGPHMLVGGQFQLAFAGEGHAAPYGGKAGDLHVVLKVNGTTGLEVVNGKAVVWAEVTPAQYVTGGNIKVDILGETVTAVLQPMTGRVDTDFRGKPLQIRASIVIPYRLSKQMQEQYAILRAQELREAGIKSEINHAGHKDRSPRGGFPEYKDGCPGNKVHHRSLKQRPIRKKGAKSNPKRG
jgi:DnaJ-class molecular chaperone